MQLKINKIINLISGMLMLIFVLTIFSVFYNPKIAGDFFKIDNIIINGSLKSNKSEIESHVLKHSNNLIDTESKELMELIKSVEWVKRANIKKKFPSTLIINIVENDPFAIYFEEGDYFLIDIDGSIIANINFQNYNQNLLFVTGENATKSFESIIKEITISFPDLLKNIEEVEFIENRRWNIKLKNELLIKLPDDDIQNSLANLKKLFNNQKIMESNVIEIDLRIDGRASLKVLDGKIKYGIDEI